MNKKNLWNALNASVKLTQHQNSSELVKLKIKKIKFSLQVLQVNHIFLNHLILILKNVHLNVVFNYLIHQHQLVNGVHLFFLNNFLMVVKHLIIMNLIITIIIIIIHIIIIIRQIMFLDIVQVKYQVEVMYQQVVRTVLVIVQ